MIFKGKTAFITGASRGIGRTVALTLAREGANVVIVAKSTEEHPKLGGSVFSVAKEVKDAGGQALAIGCDIRFEDQVQEAVDKAVEVFGGIDILINNASAINLTNVEATEPKRFDLMFDINVRGTYFVSRACIPFLKKASNPHILNFSPPINLDHKWFTNHSAYTMSKYNMSMIAIGLAGELKKYGVAANTLWPRTIIATAAIQNLPGGEMLMKMSRKPEIMADAAFFILKKPAAECTGNSFIDENVLAEQGITDLSAYSVIPGSQLYTDLFL
ncbi:NAD(P)-dependent oxidoreductase [Pollutibacter soli]|uniref:SDR family oxidoreductase n=1 Tax=Pollutibacter soli TaxID=3034157 RepID=UPI003013BBD4